MADDARRRMGKLGEDLACAELERRGYAILERGYRTRHGEIDIIARHEGVVVFVEVKARGSARFGGAAAAVTMWKQRRVSLMALDYVARHRLHERPCRFDVVTVGIEDGRAAVEVIPQAFDAIA